LFPYNLPSSHDTSVTDDDRQTTTRMHELELLNRYLSTVG